ncbi:MAG: diguanylate cyclase [Polyangiaceae bacterium]
MPSPSSPANAVLVIDDSRTIRRILRDTLEASGLFRVVLEATDGAEGLRVAASSSVDLVLCDLDMPNVDGFGFLRGFRADARNERIPVLMLSGSGESRNKVEGFALGANDYIVKPCDPPELCARVSNYLRLKILQDQLESKNRELEAKNQELAELATTDSLTGLHNRRHFLARMNDELNRSLRYGHPFAMLMLDIDHFKRINDTKGHPVGDEVLIAIARTLRTVLRKTDLLARFGGEEFVVCLPEATRESSLHVAEKVRVAVEACVIPSLDWAVTVSIGVAWHPTPGAETVEELLRVADDGLYRAKRGGRNRVAMPLTIPASPSLSPA